MAIKVKVKKKITRMGVMREPFILYFRMQITQFIYIMKEKKNKFKIR